MKRTTLVTIALTALLAVFPATLAGGGKNGGGSSSAARQQQGQAGGGQGQRIQTRQTQRSRSCATASQRTQYQATRATGDQARQQVRSMIRSQQPAGASTSQARAQRDQLSTSVRAIDREHRQLVGSLDAKQQRVLQDRVRQTNRGLEQLDERHRSLDRALADPAADSRQITERAKELDRAMKHWEKQYRKLGSEMGAEAG